MNPVVDTILILANPVIVIVQCIIFSKVLSSKDKMIEKCFEDRWQILKEHFEYRQEVMNEKYKNQNTFVSKLPTDRGGSSGQRP